MYIWGVLLWHGYCKIIRSYFMLITIGQYVMWEVWILGRKKKIKYA